jgi:succinate dehydrogenase subunit C
VNARRETWLWLAQRLTAAILAFCVLVHLATIIYAVRGGLSAAEILARTRGSLPWAAFYVAFVVAVAIHGSIGLRTIAAEWLAFRGRAAGVVVTLIGLVLVAMGLRAVYAVVLA